MVEDTDRACLWTFERMVQKTEPYCFFTDMGVDFMTGMPVLPGWWMSELAMNDVEAFEWPQ